MKIRLGPLPRTEPIKLTITISSALKARLDVYAKVHGDVWKEAVDSATLIPHMLEEFMARDRGFKAALKNTSGSAAGE